MACHHRGICTVCLEFHDFPVADYGVKCLEIQTNSDVVFGFTLALNAAKLIWIPLKDACDEVVVVLGEGGNTSLLCTVTDEILQAADLLFNEYFICDNGDAAAEAAANYKRLAFLNEQIDADYQATATAISSASQQNQADYLKLMIEQNLASSEPPVGYFELPLTKGGVLETVQSIVTTLISTMQASGLGVGKASNLLSKGDAFLASGKYKMAYAKYRLAYQQATDPGN